jgi:glycerol-3-phosphate acyltransferase PlsY
MGALVPLPAACAFGVFLAVLAATRYVSLGSVCGTASLGPLALVFGRSWDVVVLCVVVGALVVLRHRSNLGRIAAGTEPRAFQRKAAGDA